MVIIDIAENAPCGVEVCSEEEAIDPDGPGPAILGLHQSVFVIFKFPISPSVSVVDPSSSYSNFMAPRAAHDCDGFGGR